MEAKYFTSVDACSCPDYRYRKGPRGRDCKHIAALKLAVQVLARTQGQVGNRLRTGDGAGRAHQGR